MVLLLLCIGLLFLLWNFYSELLGTISKLLSDNNK